MQAFEVHKQIVSDYKEYLKSFNIIRDKHISEFVDSAFKNDDYIPEPLIQFNPSFKRAIDIKSLIAEKVIHKEIEKTFGSYRLFVHQEEAIRKGTEGKSFIVTSGTGSGKSLTFLGTIFNYLFNNKDAEGIKAVLVYPMNALINSQEEEINKLAENYGEGFPFSYSKYTGQESEEKRQEIERNPPDILLTNYMMLELILTRAREQYMRDSFSKHLRFLVFDELHTYRGRQGADVAMLIRRLKAICKNSIQCIGTSATMVSGEDQTNAKKVVADYATIIFGEKFNETQIIEETLDTCTSYNGSLPSVFDIQEAINKPISKDGSEDEFRRHPLAIWLENKIALSHGEIIRRGKPKTLKEIIQYLSIPQAELDNDFLNMLSALHKKLETLIKDKKDKKAEIAKKTIIEWISNDYHPIIFCKYIATAKYLGEVFREALPKNIEVQTITSELADEQRKEKIDLMGKSPKRLLIATDCLSEGVNLQQFFNAVMHYDLPWNPNRIEQREGRVDRFGQNSKIVKTALLWGEDNPIDAIVLLNNYVSFYLLWHLSKKMAMKELLVPQLFKLI